MSNSQPQAETATQPQSSLEQQLVRKLAETQQQLKQALQALEQERQRSQDLVNQLQSLGVPAQATSQGDRSSTTPPTHSKQGLERQPEQEVSGLSGRSSGSGPTSPLTVRLTPSQTAAAPPTAAPLTAAPLTAAPLTAAIASSPTGAIKAIYTDGACQGNPGPGGWGTVIYFNDGRRHELGGGDPDTTNNRMEMQAAVAALEYYQAHGQNQPITLYTDSEYLKNGITKWIKGWKQKGWKTSTGKPVLNQDIWEALDALNSPKVTWLYVKGHAGNEGNERCDVIARAFSQRRKINLAQIAP